MAVQLRTGSANVSSYEAKVYVHCPSLVQYQEFTPTHGFQSASTAPLHFGLGTHQKADSVVVVWPNGIRQRLLNVAANQRVDVVYTLHAGQQKPALVAVRPYFMPSDALQATHSQQPLNDFSRQLLLPQMYSYAGPRMAKGDVNGDGLDDLYLGGGKGQMGQVLIQTKQGKFLPKPQPNFVPDALCTDTDAVFLMPMAIKTLISK
ncbi:MAG: ASPIC/UnbV domain-containing protein [Rudanella sp.]|nr:ASPIC/UnbV domain-containing protein [Rudanella sp.]